MRWYYGSCKIRLNSVLLSPSLYRMKTIFTIYGFDSNKNTEVFHEPNLIYRSFDKFFVLQKLGISHYSYLWNYLSFPILNERSLLLLGKCILFKSPIFDNISQIKFMKNGIYVLKNFNIRCFSQIHSSRTLLLLNFIW